MKKIKRFMFPLLALVLLAFTGCAAVTSGPVRGSLYTNVTAPLDYERDEKGVSYSYEGMACATSYLGVVALGDASIDAAKRNGKITTVVTVDYRTDGLLGFYSRFCTIVHGY